MNKKIMSLSLCFPLVIGAMIAVIGQSKIQDPILEENMLVLASGDDILPINCHIKSSGGSELNIALCHEETYENHITYCYYFGVASTETGECVYHL